MVEAASGGIGEVSVEVTADISKMLGKFAEGKAAAAKFDKDVNTKLAKGMRDQTEEAARLNNAYDRLTSSYRPLQIAAERYKRDLADINALQKAGIVSAGSAAQFNAAATAKYNASALAIAGTGKAASSAITPMRALAGFIGVDMVFALGRMAVASLQSTKAIGDMAARLKVGTTALQELRGAGQLVGVSAGEVDNALRELGQSTDKASAGAKRESELFKILGVSLEDASGKARSLEEMLPDVTDGLARVGNESQRSAAGAIIFGEAWDEARNLLDGGSARIDKLREAVRDLGSTMSEEEIANADKTAKKLEQVKTVLQADVSRFVANNSEAILGLATALATVAGKALDAFSALSTFFSTDWGSRIANLSLMLNPVTAAFGAANIASSFQKKKSPYLGLDNGRGAFGNYASAFDKPKPKGNNIDLGNFLASPVAKPRTNRGGGGRGRGRTGPTDDQREKNFDSERQRLEEQFLQSLMSETQDAGQKAEIQRRLLDIDKQQFETKLKYDVATKRLTANQADILRVDFEKLDAQKRSLIDLDLLEATRRGELEVAQSFKDNEQERLGLQESLATTDADRRRIQLEILDSETQEAINAQDAVILSDQSNKYDIEIAEAKKAQLLALKSMKAEIIKRGTRNPLEQYLASARPGTQSEIDAAKVQILADKMRELDQRTVAFADNFSDAFGRAAGALARFESPLKVLQGLVSDLAAQFTEEFIVRPVADFVRQKAGAPLAERLIQKDGIHGRASATGLDATQANAALVGFATQVTFAADTLRDSALGGITSLGDSATVASDALVKQAGSLDEFGISLVNVLSGIGNMTPGSVSGGGGFLNTVLGFAKMAAGAGAFGGGGAGGGGDLIKGISNNPDFFKVSHIGGFASGGIVSGPGSGTSDSIRALGPNGPMRIANGEFLTNASATKKHRRLLETINSGRLPDMGKGLGLFSGGGGNSRSISFGNIIVQGGHDERADRRTGKQIASKIQFEIARTAKQGIA